MSQSPTDDSRWYPAYPMVGVGALILKERRMLLVKRSKEPSKGLWSIPGGRLELGETIEEAVKREVLEECGVQIDIVRILDVMDNILRDDDGRISYHFVLIDVLANYLSGEPKAESDAEECRWVTPAGLANLDMNPRLRAVIMRAIK
ncbi:MAG TPA: NUDIX hydrolase [Dehalococcoidales bacterium]